MNRQTLIIWTVAFVTICHLRGTAQELVIPPSGLPQERWELTYDDYRSIVSFDNIPGYPEIPPHDKLINLRKEVIMVRDAEDVYVKGIFDVCPDAWIKCKVVDNQLIINDGQLIDHNNALYFHYGYAHYDYLNYSEGAMQSRLEFNPDEDPVSFIISDDGDVITCRSQKTPAFWFDNNPRMLLMFDVIYWSGSFNPVTGDYIPPSTYGTGFPDIQYMVNMAFRKIQVKG